VAARHLIVGREGEELAAAYLQEKGLRILLRNFRCRDGEVDLICLDKKTLVFVEVKTRSSVVHGEPGEAVTIQKKRRIIRAATQYLSQQKSWSQPCRFDLVSILFLHGRTTVEHWEDIIDVRDALGGGNTAWQPW